MAVVSVALLAGACSPAAQSAASSTTVETATAAPRATVGGASDVPTGVPTGAPSDAPSAAQSPHPTEVTTVSPAPFTLASTAFRDGAPIPRRYTCDGEDASPDLTWSGAPDGTRSLALIVTDPDAGGFVHWLIYDLTGTPSGGLPTGVASSPDAPPQGTNGFGRPGYGGPCPPSGTHHYTFVLYALDRAPELLGSPRIGDIRAAMTDHVIAETRLTGTYQR